MKKNIIAALTACLFITLSFQHTKAATRNWVGGFNNNFSQANNWQENAVPVSGDIVQIGVAYTPTINIPVLSALGTTTISSLIFGTKYNTATPLGLTVNAGSTLSVINDITFKVNVLISTASNYNISGGGSITANNMYINATGVNLGVLFNFYQTVNCSINSLVLSGNLALTSEVFLVLPQVAYFNLTGGTTEVDGNIATNNSILFIGLSYPPSYVVINPSSSAGATLQLNGATALSGLSSNGTNNITFNNTYATVNYAGTTQTVYTNTAANTSGGISYYNLSLTGSGTKTADYGTLTVSNNLSLAPPTTALTLDLNANTTVSAIGNFSSNTLSTLKQGSGQNFVVTGTATNNGIINLVGNSTMIFSGSTGLTNTGTINGLSGYGSQQNIVIANGPLTNSGTVNWYGISGTYASTIITAALTNSGTINQLSLGTITANGLVTNSGTINKSNGIFLPNAGFTNAAGGVFNGTTATGTSSYTYVTGNYLNNGTLTCNNETLYFANNYTNNNIFTAGAGMVYFTGSAQTLLDNSSPGTLFNNVTFNGTGTATMTAGTGNFAVSAPGSLYMVSPAQLIAGSTTVGGAAYLSIMSTTSSTATVYTPSGTKITGNVNVQRCISTGANTRGYRLITSPVNVSLNTAGAGNLGLSYLNTNAVFGSTTYYGAFTEGPGTGFTVNGSSNPIIYLYDESRPTDNSSFVAGKNIGVYAITGSAGSPAYSVTTIGGKPATTTTGVNVPVGNSYLLYFVGSNQSAVVSSSRVPDATTITATGYLNQGNVPVKFWKSGSTTIPYDVTTGTSNYGLNQIGNPYTSTIDLVKLYSDNFNASTNPIVPSFYELIPGGNYVTYNASNGHVSDSRASQYIVSGQGFLIQAGGASPAETVTFKEDQKVAYNTSAIMLESMPSAPVMANLNTIRADAVIPPSNQTALDNNSELHLQLSRDSINYAQTGIYFSSSATDKFSQSEDAVQIDGGTPVVYLSSYSSNGVKLSINVLSQYTINKRIKLYTSANSSGTYILSMADINGVDTANYDIYLVDNQLRDSLNIVHKTYPFAINLSDTTSYGANRFVLAIQHKPVPVYELVSFSGQKVTAGVKLNWTAINAGNYTGYILQKLNANGAYDSLYSVQSDTTIKAYSFIDNHPVLGDNTYRLSQNGFTGAVTYSLPVSIGYNSTTPSGSMTLYPNPAKANMNVSLAATNINTPSYMADIYNTAGQLVKHEPVNSSTWSEDVSSYKLGMYVIRVKDTNGNLVGQAKFMKVE